jgi:peroxiredoxin
MKSVFKWFVIILVLTVLSVLIYKTIARINNKETLKEKITALPGLHFTTTDNSFFTNTNLQPDKYDLIVWFNTDCEHCQYEAQEFRKNAGSFRKTQILMVSDEPISDILKFGKTYGVDTLSYLKLLHCNYDTFFQMFGTVSAPSLFIYSPKGELLKQYRGETKLEAITKYLK